MNADRTALTDAMWARVEPMLPGKATDPGVTAADNRQFLEAVLWRIRTGSPRPRPSGALRQMEQRVSNGSAAGLSRVFSNVFSMCCRTSSTLSMCSSTARSSRRTRRRRGQKGGQKAGHRTLPRRPDEQDRRNHGRARLPGAVRNPSRPGARPQGDAGPA